MGDDYLADYPDDDVPDDDDAVYPDDAAVGTSPAAHAYAMAVEAGAPAQDRYVLLLAMLEAVAAGEDPQRTGPGYEATVGDFPLGTLVSYDDERIDPPQGVGVVMGYGTRKPRGGPATAHHELFCDDGAYRALHRDRLTER